MDDCGKARCGAEIYSDYAHHPTEIEATLKTAMSMGFDRVFAVFQPHTYSRTGELFDDFARVLSQNGADEVVVAPIYSARETNTYGVSAEALCDKISSEGKKCRFIGQFADIAEYLNSKAKIGDAIIVMGAGDVTKIIPPLKG